MNLDVLNTEGKSTGRSVSLPDDMFGVEVNEHAVYLAVKSYLANQRQGTSKAKERGEIAGSTRKVKKQKGTGTARMGSLKSPLLRSGGRVFGPKPRTYTVKLNKKVKTLARASALTAKASEGKIRIIEDFTFDAPKTSQYLDVMKGLDVVGEKVLFVTGEYDKNIYLSSRNVSRNAVRVVSDLSTYEIVHASKVVFSESAIDKLTSTAK